MWGTLLPMSNETKDFWNECLLDIESQITRANFSTWFRNTVGLREDSNVLYIGVPNEFVKEWMLTKYYKTILKIVVDKKNYIRAVEFLINKTEEKNDIFKPFTQLPQEKPSLPFNDVFINKEDNLNPKYTFQNFIVGSFNELAYAAAQGVVKRPGSAYNPLFIYGASGLGKTHLIQAIGNEIKKLNPEKRILYTSLQKFSDDYIQSLQSNKSAQYKDKYRRYDVLIMDDIQFLSGKEKTQDELFHLFNSLYEQNKNIIFSSDKHPNHILGIEDRLKTRFNAGMTIDIQEPDYESRVALIKEKSAQNNIILSEESVHVIATSVIGSIRELEGVITTISCHSEVRKKELTIEEIRLLIKNNIKPKKQVSIDTVVKVIAHYYNVDDKTIYESTRRKEVVKARQMIMYVLREDFNESYPTIGSKLGGKDHTTVIHSYEKIKKEVGANPLIMRELEEIRILFR